MAECKEPKASPKKKLTIVGTRKMLKGPKPPIKYSPSLFMADMSLLTAEKLSQTKEMYSPLITEFLDITDNATFKDSAVDPNQALFQPFPSEIIFQQYEKKKAYEFPLSLRNLDKVARHVKVTQKQSPYFTISCSRPSGQKVAPGMDVIYTLVFTPDNEKDYNHELVCLTEREKFIIPIRCIGLRAVLDFPDEIYFTSAPVKHQSTKSVLVRNVGKRESKIELKTNEPFSVSPTIFTLKPKDIIQVEIGFNPELIGDHNKELEIEYDTGDTVYVQLHGSSINVNIRLDKSSLLMEDTYIGLFTQRVVSLSNRSNIPVHFEWKSMITKEDEQYQRELYVHQLTDEESSSKDTFMERCLHNPLVRDRLPILSHTYQNKKKMVSDEKFLFTHQAFSMDPMEGDIWPNSQAEITITFQPNKAIEYSTVAFCDVTGRENRLPLKFKGSGLGPQLKFSFDTLDIQNVFVNSAHAYEVILENTGDIEAMYSFRSSSTLFGPNFTFNPSSGHLLPDNLQVIQISFSSNMLGKFEEDFVLDVKGSPNQLHLRIMGSVIGPTFQFSVSEINFGTIAYGFPVTKEIILANMSEVVMTYSLRVPLDDKCGSNRKDDNQFEFSIHPQADELPPGIPQLIKVTFTPRHVKNYSTFLVMDIAEAGNDVYSLPIRANSIVPSISLPQPYLDYGLCFLNHPYTMNVILQNSQPLLAHYEIMKLPSDSPIACTTTIPKGVIKGDERLSVPLTIRPQTRGSLSVNYQFCILGSTDPPLHVEIHCIGEGPVISVTPGQLDWGVCPVLTPIPKRLILSNESEIEATFETIFMRENGVYSVEPQTGVVPPREKLTLTVTADLDDAVKFNDKLTINVQRSTSHTVSLSAEGIGTTIVSHPSLHPSVELGTDFSCHQNSKHFVLTNRGRRTQALSWTTEGFSMAKLKKAEKETASRDKKDMAKKMLSKPVIPAKPMFQIIPDKSILSPSQSENVVITGYSEIPQSVTERLVCHSVIGRNPQKEKIMAIDVTGHFISPLLKFNKKEICFQTQQLPGSDLVKHYQDLIISRVSPLPLTAIMTCNYPFSMIYGDEKKQEFQLELPLISDEDKSITIVYDSTYCMDRHSRTENQTIEISYKEHPQKEYVSLQAEVYFPNLQFESDILDFGCLLNDTEQVKTIRMTNTSPLVVQYNWSFLKRPPIRRIDPIHDDEGVDMQSDVCDTDSLEEEHEDSTNEPIVQEDVGIGGVTVTITSPSPVKDYKDEREFEEDNFRRVSNDVMIEGLSQSLPPSEHGSDTPTSISDTPSTLSTNGEFENKEIKTGNDNKDPWQEVDDPFVPIAIEQVFDLLPLYGVIQPGETQEVQITFYGHADIATKVVAVCKVHGGPSYQLILAGESSTIQYKLDKQIIQLQDVLYDSVCEEEVIISNTGKVCFEYHVINSDNTINYNELLPGIPSVQPAVGVIEALECQTLHIRFFPGTPRPFKTPFKIQIAHFEPDTITLVGNGYYPRLSLSLPRPVLQDPSELLERIQTNVLCTRKYKRNKNNKDKVSLIELESEAERISIEEFVKERNLRYIDNVKSTKSRPNLPEYHLDFGCIVSGLTVTKRIVLTNIGLSSLSFTAPQTRLNNTGFSVNLGTKIKDLPCSETLDFTVQFDPASVNSKLGHTEAVLPLQIIGGPVYPLTVSATVALPSMELSSNTLDYGTVLCGQCKIIAIRLYNAQQVKCQWNAITEKQPKKIPKHTPLHIRKKLKEKPPPNYFEVDPSNGILLPGQKTDIQVKFMPCDEMLYNDTIPIVIYQNPDAKLTLNVTGRGSEPRIEFDKGLIEFVPIFPFSEGTETEIIVSNPTSYPVEIYSLEFDQQYQKEEDMLRWVKGYDIKHRLFLPPTEIGQSLPKEIIEAYDKRHPTQTNDRIEDTKSCQDVADDEINSNGSIEQMGSQAIVDNSFHPNLAELQSRFPSSTVLLPQIVGVSSTSVLSHGTVKASFSDPSLEGFELTPVANSIARYLGIDLSPEAALAEMRKGVAIITYGPPLSGKTSQAVILSEKYDAAILNIEELIIDVISTGSTPAGIKAREFCIEATINALKDTATSAESTAESPLSSKVSMGGAKKMNRNMGSGKKEAEEEIKKDTPEQFIVDPLFDTPYAAPGNQLTPVKLPEEVIVEILSDRLQSTDCRKGIIFDGLTCRFITDHIMTTALILRALGDRKHVFFVNMEIDFGGIADRIMAQKMEKQKEEEEDERLKLEEEEQIQALLDISEDEYELLSTKKQKEIDTIRQKRYLEKKKMKQLEKEEEERKERERRDVEQRLIEEEKSKGKKGRGAVNKVQQLNDQMKNSSGHGSGSRPDSAASGQLRQGSLVNPSAASIGSNTDSTLGKKKSAPLDKDGDKKEDELRMSFLNHKIMSEGIQNMLYDWDRVKGSVKPKRQPQELLDQRKVSATPKRKGRKSQFKGDTSPSHGMLPHPLQQNMAAIGTEQDDEEEDNRDGIGIPFISVLATCTINEVTNAICNNDLPTPAEILHSLGIFNEETPIPEPVTFQVYSYPLKRRPVLITRREHFNFISTGSDDPNAEQVIKESPEPIILEEPDTPKDSPDLAGSARLKHSGSSRVKDIKDDQGGTRRKSNAKLSSKQTAKTTPSPQYQEETPSIEEQIVETPDPTPKKLISFRWIIPAHGECKMKLLFTSNEEGQFDQIMNFEIMGTRRHYQLFCRGVCQYPNISGDPRIVFPNRKKTIKKGEIVNKRYIMDKEYYQFGPLHCGKPRDKYREGRYLDNMESINISNPTMMTSEVTVCLRYDTSAATFLYEPPTLILEPGECQPLNVWAYPKAGGEFKDDIVCTVKSNPTPILFPITAIGVEPELRLDKKHLDFGKVLLHRRESRVLHLRNNTLLPVAWKLNGLETLGDEFTFGQEQGIVQPKTEFPLNIIFRAAKPVNYSKRAFKIEVSDVEQIIGLINVEHVQLQAEAYDVALDISFPKGADGGLEFGTLRVHEEIKQAMSLKNRGKYEIGYNFQFDIGPNGTDYSKWFVLNPTSSILYAGEKSQQVTIMFKPDKELVINDEPILKCQVIDTHLGEHGEVIANIPIRFTAKSVYSKFSVSPLNDVNFGCMVITNRRINTFTIENNGEYEFRYCVSKRLSPEMQKIRLNATLNITSQQPSSRLKREHSICSRSSSVTGGKITNKHIKGSDPTNLRYEVLGGSSQRLVMGVFSIAPAYGVIGAGLSQTINVECLAEKGGKHEEFLSIEVSDANRKTMPMKYRICAEVLIPGINTTDLASIFEEHRVCKELGVLGQHQFHEDGCVGVFGETEKRFLFKCVIIGQLSKARFRILNSNKIPCDININIKPAISTGKSKLPDVFEVVPTRASIGPHSHVYAIVSFKPLAIQSYNAQFEVSIDGPSQAKSKGLTFDIQGDGNLPQVTIIKPKTQTGEHSHRVLLFQKLLLGEKQVLPILLSNVGTINSTVTVTMETQESHDCFGVTYTTINNGDEFLYTCLPLSLNIPVGETREILVSFRPQLVQTYKDQLLLVVDGNQFENMTVALIGEGYQDDVVVRNIRGPADCVTMMNTELLNGGNIDVVKGNHLYFGGCPVSEPCSLTFTLTNYSETEWVRFKWPPVAGILTFVPSLGHLQPGSSKDINVTLHSAKPKTCKYQKFVGKYWTIKYSKPVNEHCPEWDDRVKTVKWVNAPPPNKKSDETITTTTTTTTTGTLLPAKKKVIESEPEPVHEVTNSEDGYDIDMHFSAIINNADYDCPIRAISFKDTYILQTRIFQLPLKNAGLINLSYKWYLTNQPLILEESSRSSVVSSIKSETDSLPINNGYIVLVEEPINVSIEPQEGEIPPGGEQLITFKFSPVEIVDFTHYFRCQISHLSPGSTLLDICVNGSSILPYCHFDIPENDYISNRRPTNTNGVMLLNATGSNATGNIDPSTKVIEFTSTGTNHKITRPFFITNPTEMNYEFQWSCLDAPSSSPLTIPTFKCLTPKGQVTGGKKFQIIFEYLSTLQQLTESLWQFSIPSLSLTIPFLLVGHTFEPNVNIDRSYLSFKSMLIGTSITETVYLINNEDNPYQFKFNDKTCQSDTPKVKLTVTPMDGIIKPHIKLPVSVSFTAVEAREFIFNLQCNIKRKTTPLNLNVKAMGHSIDVGVSVTNGKGEELMLTSDRGVVKSVEFGKVSINERALWRISVYNYCSFGLQYQLIPSEGCFKQGGVEDKLISLSSLEGKIKSQDKSVSELTFSPGSQHVLKNCQILVKIINGPLIPITLKGSGVEPKASFSFLEYDFGPRLLLQHNMSNTATLRITNNDKNDLNINCTSNKNNGIIDIVHFEPGLLPCSESMDIDYVFRPTKAMKYKETFQFEINGVYKKLVTIKGEGAVMKIDTVNPAQRHINLGSIGINEVSCKRVRLINRSLLTVSFTVTIVPSTQIPVLHKERVLGVSICPIKGPPLREATLKPKEEIDVEVKFHPPSRVPQFTEEVIMEGYGQSHPLFVIKGSCHGIEITLDSNHVPFGAVVKSSQSTRRILLMNTGDIGAKFKWDTARFGPDFSIQPTSGYILSGMEVPFTITFHPQKLNQDIRYDNLTCNIEGSSPLYLTLTGMCIDQTPLKEVLHYTTTVRSKETRQITVHNKTAVQWVLHPIINGEHWSGPVSFTVPPGGASHYELTYHPLVMTLDAHKHTGSIFFPFPDGTGLLQNLQGTSDPPKNSGSLTKEIPCKTPHTELLPVENWLRQPQRFRAFVEHVRPEKLDHSVNLYGNDYIDVPALGKKEYLLNFYSFKEGSYLSKVTFQNESTGEYQFFHVHFKSVPPGIIGTVELTTAVRQGISHTITIDNPFQTPVNMATTVNCADITVPTNFLIGGESQGKCTFEYLPLKVGETTAKLSLQSHELGSYNYELILKATPPAPERTVHFTASLGSSQNQQCHFANYCRGRTEYICKIDNADFHVERSNNIASTDAMIDVTYEPSSLGDIKATLSISSSSGGDYLIPLQGHCLSPNPQGPFNIKTAGSITIPFRNIFHQSRQFSFSIDNPLFTVKPGDTLKPRKVYNIVVQFDKGSTDHGGSKSKQSDVPVKLGKLVVTCVQSAGHHNRGEEGIQWTYYLRGLPP